MHVRQRLLLSGSSPAVRQFDDACDLLLDLLSRGQDLPVAASEKEMSMMRHTARKQALFLAEENADEAIGLMVKIDPNRIYKHYNLHFLHEQDRNSFLAQFLQMVIVANISNFEREDLISNTSPRVRQQICCNVVPVPACCFLQDLPLCPILAIRTKQRGKLPPSWKIICPISSVLPFWVALALTG